MQQTEIKITVYNPTSDPTNFTADVYVDGRRVYCGEGGSTYKGALIEGMNWIQAMMIHKEEPKVS